MIPWIPNSKHCFLLFFSLVYLSTVMSIKKEVKWVPLLMPKVQPVENDTHLCIAMKTPEDDVENIVEIIPRINGATARHITIFGCYNPGKSQKDTPDYVWSCSNRVNSTKYEYGSLCETAFEKEFIYIISSDASGLKLPKGVAIRVGKNTGIGYIVIQMHYHNVDPFLKGETDSSGVIFKMLPGADKRITKSAGILALETAGQIPAHKEVHMEAACSLVESFTVHPISFRGHTHDLGKIVAGYKIDKFGKWHLIGKVDPQAHPHEFHPIKNLTFEKGDILASRCTTENTLNYTIGVGETRPNEMCNFYILYYVDGPKSMNTKVCYTNGPPYYYWHTDKLIGYVPKYIDTEASSL